MWSITSFRREVRPSVCPYAWLPIQYFIISLSAYRLTLRLLIIRLISISKPNLFPSTYRLHIHTPSVRPSHLQLCPHRQKSFDIDLLNWLILRDEPVVMKCFRLHNLQSRHSNPSSRAAPSTHHHHLPSPSYINPLLNHFPPKIYPFIHGSNK